jgi:TRAP-type C4-dicarboxylate transport system substrate-binding protein
MQYDENEYIFLPIFRHLADDFLTRSRYDYYNFVNSHKERSKQMKRILVSILLLVIVFSLIACSRKKDGNETSNTPAADKKVILQYSMPLPVTHLFVDYDKQWIDKIAELSNGTVTINPHWAGALIPMTSSYSETIAGVTDIVHAVPGNELEHFAVDNAAQFFYYPVSDMSKLLTIVREFYAATPEWQTEYSRTEVLTFGTSGEMYILSKRPIRTLADIKGKTFRAQCDVSFKLVEANGGNALKMPLGELYDALSKGVIDGVVIPVDTLVTMQLVGVVKYATRVKVAEPWYIHKFMNADSWNKLSENQQKALREACEFRMQLELDGMTRRDAEAFSYAKDNNIEIIEFSDTDYNAINDQHQAIAQKAIDGLNARGIDGTRIFNTVRKIVDKYK